MSKQQQKKLASHSNINYFTILTRSFSFKCNQSLIEPIMSEQAKKIGHDIDDKLRTYDIAVDGKITFDGIITEPAVLKGKCYKIRFCTR